MTPPSAGSRLAPWLRRRGPGLAGSPALDPNRGSTPRLRRGRRVRSEAVEPLAQGGRHPAGAPPLVGHGDAELRLAEHLAPVGPDNLLAPAGRGAGQLHELGL